jgi:ATP/maltotriose-dependent transcriptional regulator MalT
MSVTLPLIETKLFPARARPDAVVRERLLDEIDRLSHTALTLVDAPVGFGKTMLLQSWCDRTDSAVAWVSLDAADDDPSRLWTYVAASIERIRSGLGRPALARLRSPGGGAETAVDELVNAVNAYEGPVAIVLDDVHLLTDEACLRSFARAIEHFPAHARIVAASRSDPRLPLGRLRARGLLGEIRARELAFTLDEARELIVDREGVALADADVELLLERTEGWPAGLYLAALWLRELDDPAAGVRAFHADHRHVADYLTSEVLDVLEDDTRRFMLETSVFGRFNGRLCDDVLGRSDSTSRLHELERANGFLVALDGQGEWYRYHHLFGELLGLELAAVDSSARAVIHAGAAAWCRERGLVDDALEHAAAAGDVPTMAAILVDEHLPLLRAGNSATVLRWCSSLPDDLQLDAPQLPIAAAIAAGFLGRPAHVRHRFIRLAERARDERPERWTPYCEAGLGLAVTAWIEGDVAAAAERGRGTVEAARDVPASAVPALGCLGFALFLGGEHEEAARFAQEAVDRPEAPARPHGLVLALATLSLVDSDAGRSEAAESLAREALAAAAEAGVEHTASGGAAHVALAEALAGRGRLRQAEREAATGERLRRQPWPEAAHLHALVVLAGIRVRRGLFNLAGTDLEKASRKLESFTDAGRLPALAAAVAQALETARSSVDALSEAPSAAELTVLRLLASDLSQREIGAHLYLSLNTVKTHARSLYRKLGVSSREQAVVRATALGLLESRESPG